MLTIAVAGDLLVDLRATDPTAGTVSWTNRGTLGGAFARIGNPDVADINGIVGLRLNYDHPSSNFDDAFQGPQAPANVRGGATRTIEVWAFNPNDGLQGAEETAVAWGRRGGPNGSNLTFGYGNNGTFGAVGHWGTPDMPWNMPGGTPPLGAWHHLVYTYDGSTARVYSDGVLRNTEVVGILSTHPGTINIGAQNNSAGALSLTEPRPGSLAVANVRIHTGVLSANDILANFNEGVQVSQPPPVSTPDSYAINEDGILNVNSADGVLKNDSDPASLSITAILGDNPVHGALTLNGDGSFVYTPTENYFGPDSFTYRASNGLTQSPLTTVSLTVNAVYDPVLANPDRYDVAKGVALVVSAGSGALANDVNADNATLTASMTDNVDHGTLIFNTNGSFTYTPAAGYTGADAFSYRVFDGTGNSNITTVTLTVNTPPVADNDDYTIGEDQTLNVPSSTGVLFGDTDAESSPLTASLIAGPSHGTLTLNADGSFTYTPSTDYFGNDSFTYRASDGSHPSGVATVTLHVTSRNDAPTANADTFFGLQNQQIQAPAINGVLANDADVDGPARTAVLVDSASNGALTLNANGSFTYIPAAGFTGIDMFTYRVNDSIDQSAPVTVTLVVSPIEQTVVINEIHYEPIDNRDDGEFIELYNFGSSTADLSGWKFTDGIEYTFPIGTQLAPGQYLLIGEHPPTLQASYGLSALGPWTGNLSNEGEQITLRNGVGGKVDEVDYGIGFPWPLDSSGDGASIELIHPSLDNDLGGSWRASGQVNVPPTPPQIILPAKSTWKYRKGLTAPSSPIEAWRDVGFTEDETWLPGQTPIGFADNDDTTVLADMRNLYISVFLRNTFTIASANDMPKALRVRVYVDDGAIIYLNGEEVKRLHVSDGAKSHTDGTGTTDHEAAWEEFLITNPAQYLNVGQNVIAIHGINQLIGSSDFSIDAELVIPGSDELPPEPTPMAQNSAYSLNAPPQVRQVEHGPSQPLPATPATITAKITDPQGVASVSVAYQVVQPGQYIPAFLPLTHQQLLANANQPRQPNPAFEDPANWTTVSMFDDGANGDATAGDGIYTAVLPGQVNRALVRYRITATDTVGASVRVPYADDPSLNFAYFVYAGVPDYSAPTSVNGVPTVHDQEKLTSMPVYTLITRNADMTQATAADPAMQIPQGTEARFSENWEGAFVYDGVVYDHINYRLRGANGRYQIPPGNPSNIAGKRHWRLRFNKGTYLQARDEWGEEYPTEWQVLNIDRMFGNRLDGNWGLSEQVNYKLWDAFGVPSPYDHTFHWRVIDGADEAPDQYNGDFWGIARAFEDYDVRFLDAHGLERGNLYKLVNQTNVGLEQERYLGPDAVHNGADHDNIEANVRATQTEEWLNNYINYDNWYRYHAVAQAVRHYDYWPEANKNAAWYFEPIYTPENNFLGKMWTLPFDTDASWGPTWNAGQDRPYAAIYGIGGGTPKPAMQAEYRNAIREVLDLMWQRDQLEPLIRQTAAFIDPLEEADRDRWRNAPAQAGRQDFPGQPGQTLEGKIQDMLRFAFTGGTWVDQNVGPGGRAADLLNLADAPDTGLLPVKPTATYNGSLEFPIDGLTFQSSAFSDPQGAGTFGAMEWRLAEVDVISNPATIPLTDPLWKTKPFKLEVIPGWESGELTSFGPNITVPASAVEVGKTYRVRVRMKDNTGRWSHWSDPVQFVAGVPNAAAALQSGLRITEVMYNPPAPDGSEPNLDNDEFEYVEIRNTGPVALNLSNVRLSGGIDFDFTGGQTTLAPSTYGVIVKNPTAFAARYGSGINVIGTFTRSLSNAGDVLGLTYGGNVDIHNFTFDDSDAWYGRTDGNGSSLEIVNLAGDPNLPSTWRSSVDYAGSPGRPGIEPFTSIVINEIRSRTLAPALDAIELHNPSNQDLNIGGWYLSDSNDTYRKFQVPNNTFLPAGGYLVLDEDDFNVAGTSGAFAFDGIRGDDLWVVQADGAGRLLAFADSVHFDAADTGQTYGRWPNGSGRLLPMTQPTLGGPNALPHVGSVVISEVMYHHPSENLDLEYVELYNRTANPINLSNWKISGGIDFVFPAGANLGAYASILVLPFNPSRPENAARVTAFRAAFGLDDTTPLLGGYNGLLDGAGDRLRLLRPGTPPLDEPNFTPELFVDEVDYAPASPWPHTPDGAGESLTRFENAGVGNDPLTWTSATPTPGGHVTTLAASTHVANLHLSKYSVLRVAPGGDKTLRLGSLSMHADSFLDLNNNAMVVHNGDVSAIRALLTAGRGSSGGVVSGKWNGTTGISSTSARNADAISEIRVLGYALNKGLLLKYQNFAGIPVGDDDVLIRYTKNGDANLDGVVNNNDITILAGNYRPGVAGKHWYQADFNYDGEVNNNDITILAGFYAPNEPPVDGVAQPAFNAGSEAIGFSPAEDESALYRDRAAAPRTQIAPLFAIADDVLDRLDN